MLERARELKDEIVKLRRTIHRHPELGFHEVETAALVAQTLESLGIRVETGVADTGVVGFLGAEGPTVAIRADMDALPIQELNEVPYRSEVPGVMHACGHDAHVAMALGAAMILSERELAGQVRFLFQPAEEKGGAEGRGGATRMVEDGAMQDVQAIIALHVWEETDTGYVNISPGPVAAAVDSFNGTILGKGCHGAHPDWGVDPIFLSGHVMSAIHGIVSRRIDPMQPAVISVCAIHGGTAFNIIPEEVTLEGTIRSFDEGARRKLHAELARAFEVTRSLGGDFQLNIGRGHPTMINDQEVSQLIQRVATDVLGEGRVLPFKPQMGGEDFGILAREAPGAMFMLGIRRGQVLRAHTPHFDIDEDALPIGTGILAKTAIAMLDELVS